MTTYLLSFLVVISLALAGPAAAQQAAGASLAAVALPAQAAQPNAAAVSVSGASTAPLVRADSIFINPQVLPQFPGGDDAFRVYLQKNLRYPEEALRQHITGKVFVSFVLSATGLVTYATVLRGPSKLLNEEALRLVWHMPAWQPARQRGQAVRVSCTIPIIFVQ